METRTIAIVNQVQLQLIENGDKLVPVRPICEALGIDSKVQRTKINDDDFLSSVGVLSTSTGSDGKQYEMFCLPLKYVFGWLFTINPKNVKEEARDTVQRYRLECYDVLYRHFTEHAEFIEQKDKLTDKYLEAFRAEQEHFKNAKTRMEEARKQLDEVRKASFDFWKANNRQLRFDFDET